MGGMWILNGFENALRMAWEVWWALILGFALSGAIQAYVPRERLQRALGGRGLGPVALATGLGAASSSCSYAAIAIAKTLFAKGASLVSAMAFQFASTNLVFELGIVLWLFLGWQFTLAEFVGGLILILVMWLALSVLVSRRREEEIRTHTEQIDAGHVHSTAASMALNFRNDIQMLWKEIAGGLLIAGYVSLLPRGFFQALFVTHAWAPLRIVENVVVGPIVAALAFVCSVGNIPLAAVLWAGGSSFAGVIAFIFADLIIVPIVNAYRKYYGTRFALLLTGVMFGAMAIAALVVDGIFSLVGLVPVSRPSIASVAERPVAWNYTSFLDILFAAVFVVLIALTLRRGASDPVCGMAVERDGEPSTTARRSALRLLR